MRERVDFGEGETEIRVEFVGDAKGAGFETEAEEAAVACVGEFRVGYFKRGDLGWV